MGGIISSAVSVAAPVVGTIFGGPVGGAIGGAIGSAVSGGNPLTGALMGGIGGYMANPSGSFFSGGTAPSIADQLVAQGLTPADAAIAAQSYSAMGLTPTTYAAQTLQSVMPGLTAAEANTLASSGLTPQGAMTSDLATLQYAAANPATTPSMLSKLIGGGTGQNATGQNALTNLTGLSGSALSSIGQGAASLYGAQMGADAAKAATQETTRQFNIAQANQAPWLAAGQKALTEQQKLMFGTPQDIQTSLQGTPGYQWRLQQGQQGLDAGLAARGGMGSGKSAVAASEYNQNFASNEYQNALNRLAGLSGTGQTTAGTMAQQGAGYSQVMGDVGMKYAAQRQSGLLGAANALTSYANPTPTGTGMKFDPNTGLRIA